MAEVLVVVEASQAAGVKKVTLEMLTLARESGRAVRGRVRRARHRLAAKLGEYGAASLRG